MLVTGYSMLVEDPVFSGNKEKTFLIPFPLKAGFPLRYDNSLQQVSRGQHPVSLQNFHHNILKLDINSKILVYKDNWFASLPRYQLPNISSSEFIAFQ
jgi:hypothetical protein